MTKLFILFLVLLMGSCQPQVTKQPARFKTIMLRASGEIETLPNQAAFTIHLTCLDKSVKSSKQCLVEKSNALNRKLTGMGIGQDDILTTAVNLNKSYTWARNTRVFEGYQSSTMMQVTVKNLDKLEEIYTDLLENRNLELAGLSYSHSGLDSLSNEAYVKALKNANVLAGKLVRELPESETEILKIGNVQITSSMPESMPEVDGSIASYVIADEEMARQTSSARKSISISSGTVKVYATLYVEYLVR